MSALNENAITRLATVSSVDMNSATASLLYSVPSGKSLAVMAIVIRNPSISLTTASLSFGFNNAVYNDVFPNSTYASLINNFATHPLVKNNTFVINQFKKIDN